MTNDRIDRLVREADPYDPAAMSDLRGADGALLEEIMMTAPQTRGEVEGRPRWRRPLVAGLVAASVLAVAIAIPPMLGGSGARSGPGDSGQVVQSGGGSDTIVYTAAAVEVAKSNPRLLIDEPGWTATTVYGFAKDSGTINFAKGDREIEMNWYPAASYDIYYRDRGDISDRDPIMIDGQTGSRISYSATDVAAMLKPEGSTFVEIRAVRGFKNSQDVLSAFAKIKHVDVNTWLAALPPEVVVPARAAEMADHILADIPLPPGFDRDALTELGVNDRYQFGAETVTRVVCGWLDEWQRADQANDQTAVTTARDAVGSTREWRILSEMAAEGDYSDDMWTFSDTVRSGESLRRLAEFRGCADVDHEP